MNTENHLITPHEILPENEFRHDDATLEMFALAQKLAEAHVFDGKNPNNSYAKLHEVITTYLIDSTDSTENTPKVTAETRNGHRSYTLTCLASVDFTSGELCIVKKDPHAHSDDPTDWFVVQYNINSGELNQRTVLFANTAHDSAGDTIQLSLAPIVSYQGDSQLVFTVAPDYSPSSTLAAMSHRPYYGRGTGSEPENHIDATYTDNVKTLLSWIEYESNELRESKGTVTPLHNPARYGNIALKPEKAA
jgi:hypothetical protein